MTESDVRQYYEKALRMDTKMLVNYLIKQIILYKDKIEIHFNSPLESPDESRGFSLEKKIMKCSYENTFKRETISIRFEIETIIP